VTDTQTVTAPAKLTLSLRVTGRRDDGYHLLDIEMVTVDLVDVLTFSPGRELSLEDEVVGATGTGAITTGADNLVARALELVDRQASVHVVKRIPAGAGLGGGSADAAAVLRWAGRRDLDVALRLGSDVPFCVGGGRARVTGVGEAVEPLPYEQRSFVLLVPPLSVSTADVYRAFDDQLDTVRARSAGNDLEQAALAVAPRLEAWRHALAQATGSRPRLAGSGSTWFVEGSPADVGLEGREYLDLDGERAALRAVATVPGGA
jgi:4-diphosphocytidyl-2-C-methyl-D-erythritol kinase